MTAFDLIAELDSDRLTAADRLAQARLRYIAALGEHPAFRGGRLQEFLKAEAEAEIWEHVTHLMEEFGRDVVAAVREVRDHHLRRLTSEGAEQFGGFGGSSGPLRWAEAAAKRDAVRGWIERVQVLLVAHERSQPAGG